ncbi:formate dehydrogenase accessory sulfurtransferase FdhD [Novosphingobium sp. FSY-8]|uniref:Sulfur carrier protein FdhD n=1 Tax=Novosphingobium ovatum TaxID=1908523 RepID=A0ABW9XHB6_9SPHN|nr:formate dehydrogenase accessory sulfurtransferase FdhD [Novosphingobium ovatum]NBC37906.1 formate dehydrogenase accessory sulfurtransferase FdhD [Novosphingobium ovatum]
MTLPPPEMLPALPDGGGLVFRADGGSAAATRSWVPEVPVALEFNGLSYAVMMASPTDLADFASGFALSEGIATSADQITAITPVEVEQGWIIRTQVAGLDAARLSERVRARVAESSCGLCGIDNLAAIARPLPPVRFHSRVEPAAIFAALRALRGSQALGQATGAAHAAALCDGSGAILGLREDVGRHNAMDKLIGAAARAGLALGEGFVLSTARCSYEIVEKAVKAGATSLVTISLPTSMAVARAAVAGLSLWVLARDDSVTLAHDGALCVHPRALPPHP